MATRVKNTVFHQLRQVALAQVGAELTDGQLLESFVTRRDEAAFQNLMRRHGPMVLGVCRRVLHSHHDAEDAFQATFLVLVRKASSIKPREMVAGWLHGVAYRTALKARAAIGKRQVRERQILEDMELNTVRHDPWSDLRAVLDQELCRLPDKYRMPLILCDIEGKSIKEMTRQLGWPQGTVAGRLARARTMLAKRLSWRGVALAGGSIAAMMLENAASACAPIALVSSTIQAAKLFVAGRAVTTGAVSAQVSALIEGVVRGMVLAKLKSAVSAAVVIGALVLAGGLLTQYPAEAQQGQVDTAPTGGTKTHLHPGISLATQTQQKSDLDRLQGLWMVTEAGGKPVNAEKVAFMVIGNRACWQTSSSDEVQGGLYLDPTSHPKKYDFAASNRTIEGIYALDGDTLRLCYSLAEEGKRPKEFSFKPQSQQILLELKREKGANIHDFRRPDGSKAFPTIIERNDMAPQPAPKSAQAPLPPRVNGYLNEAEPPKRVKAPVPRPVAPVNEAAEQGPYVVVLDNATLIIGRGAKMRIRPVKTAEGSRVRLEIPGVTIEVPRLRLESEMHVWQVNISKQGLLEMETSPRLNANAKVPQMPSARVANIIVIGNKRTPAAVLLKRMALVPGQAINFHFLRTAEKNLAEFNATITVLETDNAAFKDILLRVNEESPPPSLPPPPPLRQVPPPLPSASGKM